MFNNLFRSRQPDPYVIRDCRVFQGVAGLIEPLPGFHFDDEEEMVVYGSDDENQDHDLLGPLPPVNIPLMSQAERTQRQQQIADQMARAAQEQDVIVREEQPFPDCVICGEYLNNVNCNDVVNVCENNHLFHRGCILTSCNARRVDIAGQMRSPYPASFREQSIASLCPMCKQPLVPSCEGLRDKERVPTENINEEGLKNKGGRKTRRSRNKGKNKKSMKKGKNKKLVKKGKSMKRVKKVKSMKRRRTMKKRK
jgi:hypothetical protein